MNVVKLTLRAVLAAALGIFATSASAATITVAAPNPAPAQFIFLGGGGASVTDDGVTFSTSASFGDTNFFEIGTGYSSAPAPVLSSQKVNTGSPNILITLPNFTTAATVDFGTFYGANVAFGLSNGDSFTRSSTGSGYATPDIFTVMGEKPFDAIQLSSAGSVLNVESVTFNTGAVPEPATWAMLILGVGMVGLAARRRNRGLPVAA